MTSTIKIYLYFVIAAVKFVYKIIQFAIYAWRFFNHYFELNLPCYQVLWRGRSIIDHYVQPAALNFTNATIRSANLFRWIAIRPWFEDSKLQTLGNPTKNINDKGKEIISERVMPSKTVKIVQCHMFLPPHPSLTSKCLF